MPFHLGELDIYAIDEAPVHSLSKAAGQLFPMMPLRELIAHCPRVCLYGQSLFPEEARASGCCANMTRLFSSSAACAAVYPNSVKTWRVC